MVVGDDTWLTVSEAVARIHGVVKEQSIRRLCDEGTLVSRRLPGTRNDRRILASSLDAYFAQFENPAPGQESPSA